MLETFINWSLCRLRQGLSLLHWCNDANTSSSAVYIFKINEKNILQFFQRWWWPRIFKNVCLLSKFMLPPATKITLFCRGGLVYNLAYKAQNIEIRILAKYSHGQKRSWPIFTISDKDRLVDFFLVNKETIRNITANFKIVRS